MYNSVSSRKGGRVVECTGLENQRWVTPIRGFESHPFRQQPFIYAGFRRFQEFAPQNAPHSFI